MTQLKQPERRVSVRWDSTQQAPCHFATLEKITARWATVLNVSVQGIGLGMPCTLDPGAELIIELPCKDAVNPKAVIARVVHSKLLASGTWAVGCTFAKPLTQEEIDSLK